VNSVRGRLILLLAAAAVLGAGCRRPLADSTSYSESNVALLRTALGGDKVAAATTIAAAEPTGWATLKGVFKINGSPPSPVQLAVTSDHAVCAPGGKPVYSNDIVVDPASGGLGNVVIYLETKYPDGDAKWEHPDYATAAGEVIFDQKNCVFLTHVFAMRTSQALKVLNSDPVGHNTRLEGGGGARPANFTVPAGGSETYVPGGEATEPFKVACSIHPWMAAYGLVRKNPYFAVSQSPGGMQPAGAFEIKNLPAGVPLRFRIWQERAQFIRDVKISGQTDKYNKGRMDLKLEPDEARELELTVEASLF
jgi:hypothetical protein